MHRILAVFVVAALGTGAVAADKPAKATRASAVAQAVGPSLKSAGVMVLDPTTGETLYSKNADEVTPIASITKLMTAMVVLDAGQALDESIAISNADIDRLKGTTSRLRPGVSLPRREMLRLALMSSENRAASALSRHFPGGTRAFVAAMNRKARELGMNDTHFVEPTGLNPNNVSTALDLARMVNASYHYTLIRDRERMACFRAFQHNNWVGAAVFAGIALDYGLR